MDNQATEPTGDLSIDQATNIFANILEPKEPIENEVSEAVEPTTEAEPVEAEAESVEGAITVEIDGKMVTLTPEQIAESYKNGLRQSDYTKKTMEVAETRKEAEQAKAQAYQERQAYAEKLNMHAVQLQGALQEQSQINWQELLENDPVEYLKQQHLVQTRQASLQQTQYEWQEINQLNQQEQTQALQSYLQAQQQELIAKLPAWKDEAKAKADIAEMREFLKSEGRTDADIDNISNHKDVLIIRDAMAFRKLLKQSPEATKRVQSAPVRAERSGTGENSAPADAHKSAMNRLRRSGSIEDATRVFANLL
jgi:Rps23 Pro-64 3,4-dihydroxylase Tpa1-like proline 4-hydroxylase